VALMPEGAWFARGDVAALDLLGGGLGLWSSREMGKLARFTSGAFSLLKEPARGSIRCVQQSFALFL